MKKMYLDVVHIYIFVFFKSDEWLQSYDLKCINMYKLDGGVYIGKFFEFSNFFKLFHTNVAQKSPTIANLAEKVALIGSKWPNLVILHNFLSFPPK